MGFEPVHAHVVLGIIKAWMKEFKIWHRPDPEPDVYVADYSALADADQEAEDSGVGKCYGQLVVLGYKEVRLDEERRDELKTIRNHCRNVIPHPNPFRDSIRSSQYLAQKDHDGPDILQPRGERNESFMLRRREKANGIRKDSVIVQNKRDQQAPGNIMATHRVTMTVSQPKARADGKYTIVTEYIPDDAYDMFQFGRLQVKQNDVVVR